MIDLEPGSKIFGTFDWEGERATITNLFDIDGDPTQSIEDAITCVAYLGPDRWLSTMVAGLDITGVM